MKKTKVSFKQRFRYRFDNFFSRGGTSIFLVLISMFGLALLLMGFLRILTNFIHPDPFDQNISQWTTQLWRAALQVVDIGSLAEDSDAGALNKSLGVVTSLTGLALVSTMLAFITSIFKEKLESLRKGKSTVIESGHTIILGFGIRTIEIIKELIEANASEKDAAVVVLA